MRFQVTSITFEDEAKMILAPLCRIEDWLNAAMADGDFGPGLDSLMIVVISYYIDEQGQISKVSKPSRFSSYKDPITGNEQRCLALHVSVEDKALLAVGQEKMVGYLSRLIAEKLPERPLRLPKGLDYARLRTAIQKGVRSFSEIS
ncbi:hypothetical protein GM658_07785 [Pseudoduganella eburnea]|uniref:Uncharacterized protein n=1 Tax=Massilia eburnea TaxID=1776165 RepID=A0A6L6QFT2_9BURK|nr:hypothetical protein [Massilia eburnea]MTW10503.1 hypothetical protein [Massilia eburnea]